MPHAGILLGRSRSSRGYRLPGYGIVFVLTPRALPGDENVFVVRRPHGHSGGPVHVERHVTVPVDQSARAGEEEQRQGVVRPLGHADDVEPDRRRAAPCALLSDRGHHVQEAPDTFWIAVFRLSNISFDPQELL